MKLKSVNFISAKGKLYFVKFSAIFQISFKQRPESPLSIDVRKSVASLAGVMIIIRMILKLADCQG